MSKPKKKQSSGILYRYDQVSQFGDPNIRRVRNEELKGYGGNDYFSGRTITEYGNQPNDTVYYDLNGVAYPGDPRYSILQRGFNNAIRKNIVTPVNKEVFEGDWSVYPEGLQKWKNYYNSQMNELNKSRVNLRKQREAGKYQQGGQLGMNEQQLQQAFIQFLAQKTGAKNQQELEAAIQQLGEEGLKQAYAEFMQLIQQQQVQAAKFGAKLNYIKSLRGQCPEGYEISYYKVGGTLCKKCMKKQQEMKDGGQVPKNPIDEFKCGRKMKKAQGGAVDFEKCGGKTKKPKKKAEGGELNSTTNPKAFSKMALAKCGAKLKEACKGVKMQQGNKVKPKLQPKKKTARLNPDTTKKLPGGKYPSYWTSDERIRWERKWGPQDEGAHVSPPSRKVPNKKQ